MTEERWENGVNMNSNSAAIFLPTNTWWYFQVPQCAVLGIAANPAKFALNAAYETCFHNKFVLDGGGCGSKFLYLREKSCGNIQIEAAHRVSYVPPSWFVMVGETNACSISMNLDCFFNARTEFKFSVNQWINHNQYLPSHLRPWHSKA